MTTKINLDEIEALKQEILELQKENITLKKTLNFDMSTYGLVKKNALKHANSVKPNEIAFDKWVLSKERKVAYNAFIIGAKCEHQYMKIEKEKLKQECDEYRDVIGELIKIFNYEHQSIYKFAKTEIDRARKVLAKWSEE